MLSLMGRHTVLLVLLGTLKHRVVLTTSPATRIAKIGMYTIDRVIIASIFRLYYYHLTI